MIRWLVLLLAAMLATPAQADELRPGYIELTQQGGQQWRLVWKAPLKGGITPQTQPILPQGCAAEGTPKRALSGLALITTSKVRCSAPMAGKKIGLSNFSASQTDVLVRIAQRNSPVLALRLTPANPIVTIPERPGRWQVGWTYFVTGIDHILTGYDHLLFVVALVLLLAGGWTVVKAVTAFTVAHSITLIGTTLGLFGLPQRPVEAVIALSILFLAVEIAKKTPGEPRLSERIPWVVAFAFGLLHGFGFAGALREIGLPQGDVQLALATFNIGVEAGQLLIVLASFAAIALINRLPPSGATWAFRAANYAIGAIAGFWFIDRMVNIALA